MIIVKDIAIKWDNRTGKGEWLIENGDIALDNALHSAVMVSLFSDRLAPLEPILNDQHSGIGKIVGDRRGWWGDMLNDQPIGSRLWQLRRAVKADRTSLINSAKDIANEALTWLIEDGVAATVTVNAEWKGNSTLILQITIVEPQHNNPTVFLFSWAWEGI